jgi:hypothetical protein
VVLGLTGAVLAVAPTWGRMLPVAAGAVALGALATPVVSLVQGAPWQATVVAALNAAVVLGLLWLTVVDFLRGRLVGGLLLLAVGVAVALELVLFAGGAESPWFETVHGQRLGLLPLPVVAACGARPVWEATNAVVGEPDDARAARWVAVAVRALDLVMLMAGFVALVALVRIVGDGVAVSFVLRLVVGVLMLLALDVGLQLRAGGHVPLVRLQLAVIARQQVLVSFKLPENASGVMVGYVLCLLLGRGAFVKGDGPFEDVAALGLALDDDVAERDLPVDAQQHADRVALGGHADRAAHEEHRADDEEVGDSDGLNQQVDEHGRPYPSIVIFLRRARARNEAPIRITSRWIATSWNASR